MPWGRRGGCLLLSLLRHGLGGRVQRREARGKGLLGGQAAELEMAKVVLCGVVWHAAGPRV